jgi:protein-tyrosine-phosphatase
MKVLFVCSGNICRSPMAAEYFRHRCAHDGLSHVVVDSAGTLNIVGAPASPESVEVMREIGVDLSRHRSKGISGSLLGTSDVVVVMSRGHLDHLAEHHGGEGGKRVLLRAFEKGTSPDPNAAEVPDPIGQPMKVYRELVPLITGCIDHLILHLKHQR